MYCYPYVSNQFTCIFNELQLWSHISSEHPTFFKKVASLSKINLPGNVVEQLDDIHRRFLALYNNVVYLKRVVDSNPNLYKKHIVSVRKAIDDFIQLDRRVLSFYPQLLGLSGDKSWQELVKHITSEQAFMMELMSNLRKQVRF